MSLGRRIAAVAISTAVLIGIVSAPVTTVPNGNVGGVQTVLGQPPVQAHAAGVITVKPYAGGGVIYKNISGSTFWCYPGWERSGVRSFTPPAGWRASWSYAGEKRRYTASDWTPVTGTMIIWAVYIP